MSVKGRLLFLLLGMVLIAIASGAVGQTTNFFPGGWIEKDGAGMRSRYSTAQLQSFIPPQRGAFTFPSPYNTRGIRITDTSDCGGADCVWYVGYSYWRNTNAHQNSNDMLIFLGLASNRGGAGPTLFKLDKTTDAITKVGPLFPSGSKYRDYTGEGWYFSHGGSNWGFQCYAIAHRVKGYGVAIMTNGDGGGAAMQEIETLIQQAYGWDVLDKPIPRTYGPIK